MAQVSWTAKATQHLAAICEYIEQMSSANARAFAEEAIALANSLTSMPRSGSVVSEYGQQNIREKILKGVELCTGSREMTCL
jgi:plasmid stabilization system protein ParE